MADMKGFPTHWTTLQKLIFLQAMQGGGGGGEILTVTGVSPLLLVNSLAHSIKSLTQYGKVEQRNLPQGYTELDYIEGDGTQYIDLDTALNQDDVIEIEFELTADQNSRNIFGYRYGASSNNIMLFLGGTNNRVFIDFNNSNYSDYRLSYDCEVGTRYKAIISKSRRAFLAADGTVLAESTTLCEDTIACPSAYLFHASGSPTYNNMGLVKIYSCKITGKRNLVGAKDAADVVEMYDKVSASPFVNAGTGAFVVGSAVTPSPSAPMDIWTNNGALRYSANMANVNEQTALVGYYISAQGVVTADANNWMYQNYIPVKPSTTYTLSISSPVYYVSISEYSTAEDSGFVVRKAGSTGGNTSLTITTEANTNYIRFGTNIDRTEVTLERVLAINWMLNEGDAAIPYVPYVVGGIYADGTPETLTVSGNIVEFNETRIDNTTWASADKSHGFEVYADVYSKHVGNSLFSNGNAYGAFIPCAVGQSVSINFFDYAPYYGRCYYCEVTADGKCNTEPVKYSSNTALTQQTFTLTQTDSIGFVIEWYISTEERDYTKENYAVCYGTTPLAAYQPYTPIQTVNDVPMLLSVGDYKDEGEIIDGIKTGKVGVMVLDGTENWGTSLSTKFYLNNTVMRNYNNMPVLCSHYEAVLAAGTSGVGNNQIGLFASGTQGASDARLVICDPRYTAKADFQASLAAQYAAGTPVIVIYPLAEETTEQTTPHALHSYNGTTVVDAQTSVDPVTLSVEYKGVAA